ncbi:MAG TPA: hypothetical protein VK181_10500 [Rhizobium sp.]|nr:hypothetical protein [Rhizobium sp.]
MAYLLTRLRAAIAAWDVILLAVALTVAAFIVWPGWVRQAKEAGALSVRLEWMEKQRRAAIDAEKIRQEAQAKIDAAERQLINRQIEASIERDDLLSAIKEERESNADKTDDNGAACRPMPDRVRNALNAIGGRRGDGPGSRQ